jgi:hypothetical protein
VSRTTGKPEFAVRENLCRAFSLGRTAKMRIFAVRLLHGARQKKSLPCVFSMAHGKKTFGKKIVCRAFLPQRTTKKYFSVRFFLGARQTFFPHQMLPSITTVSLRVIFAVR